MNTAAPVSCDAAACPACACVNDCRRAATGLYKGPCWCESVSVSAETLARLPETLRGTACLCRGCITRFEAENTPRAESFLCGGGEESLERGRDFEVDANGLFVFTAAYLKQRGWCCGNGCRNCPY